MPLPLSGQTVLVTRAAAQSGELCDRLRALGATPLEAAAIAVVPPETWRETDAALKRLNTYQWLVFTSPNGVRMFMDRLTETGGRVPPGVRVAAVGPATAEALAAYRVHVGLVPSRHDAAGLAAALVATGTMERARVMMPRGDLADGDLPRALREAGATVAELTAYRTMPAVIDGARWEGMFARGEIDWVLVASGSAIRNLAGALEEVSVMRSAKIASIGPKASAAVRELGLEVAVEAAESTLEGLLGALVAPPSA